MTSKYKTINALSQAQISFTLKPIISNGFFGEQVLIDRRDLKKAEKIVGENQFMPHNKQYMMEFF